MNGPRWELSSFPFPSVYLQKRDKGTSLIYEFMQTFLIHIVICQKTTGWLFYRSNICVLDVI